MTGLRHPAAGIAAGAAVYAALALHCALHAGWWTGGPVWVAMAASFALAQRPGQPDAVAWSTARSAVWWLACGLCVGGIATGWARPLGALGAVAFALAGAHFVYSAWRGRRALIHGGVVAAVRRRGFVVREVPRA